MRRVEETIVQAVADLPFGLQAANGIERLDMRLHQVTQNMQCMHDITFAGIGAMEPCEGITVWFIDGQPEIAEIAEPLHDIRYIAHKETSIGLVCQAAPVY